MKRCPNCCPREERRATIYDQLESVCRNMRLSLRDARTLDRLADRYDLKIDTSPIKKNADGNAREALDVAARLVTSVDADPLVILRHLRT